MPAQSDTPLPAPGLLLGTPWPAKGVFRFYRDTCSRHLVLQALGAGCIRILCEDPDPHQQPPSSHAPRSLFSLSRPAHHSSGGVRSAHGERSLSVTMHRTPRFPGPEGPRTVHIERADAVQRPAHLSCTAVGINRDLLSLPCATTTHLLRRAGLCLMHTAGVRRISCPLRQSPAAFARIRTASAVTSDASTQVTVSLVLHLGLSQTSVVNPSLEDG
ncbi:hypothetical protein BC628DRAFT_171157 [Trametes gibbosa]|nr:hypothetical protein BC628DRAFT_171157 [Trametes gibbosa]